LIAAGGTGGHVFPALAVAQELRSRGVDLKWLGTATGLEAERVPRAGIAFEALRVTGLRGRGLARLLRAPVMLLRSLLQAVSAIRHFRPHAVLGMGGYVSGPVGVAAWLLRRPLLIHEQNAIPGTTNKLLAPLATVVLEAFPGAFDVARKAIHTGNPLRRAFREHFAQPCPAGRDASGTDHTKRFRILVLGGSQGALALNETLPRAFSCARNKTVFQIWHQCGQAHVELTRGIYSGTDLDVRVDAFIEDMPAAYAWADVVICRSGAMTVAELACAGVASILVPFPYAVDDHQSANARFLAQPGAAIVIPQDKLNADAVGEQLDRLCADAKRLLAMGTAAKSQAMLDATERVANLCLEQASV
jgi:UDP-N-acetylglucosamine--N-acetylmuramyl-(pentapeptide) pyrophosphoryl-undecaprenol N-acetylglucosamine transferase